MNQIYPVPVKVGNKYGYEDQAGRVVIQPLFDFAREFSEGLAAVRQDVIWKYIDIQGKIVIDKHFYDAEKFNGGRAWVLVTGNKWGSINKQGKFIVEPQFDKVPEAFSDGLIRVWIKGLIGVVDQSYKIVVQPQFQRLGDFSDGWAVAVKGDKYCYVDKSFKVVLETPFDNENWWLENFYENMAVLRTRSFSKYGENNGYINKSGNIAIKPQFKYAKKFSEGLAAVYEGLGNWGYIDKTGQFVIKNLGSSFTQAESVGDFVNGLVQFESKVIDKSGKIIYELCSSFDAQNMVLIRASGKYGWAGKSKEILIQPKFDDYRNFEGEITFVKINGKWGCINRRGQMVTQAKYAEIKPNNSFVEGMAAVRFIDKWGYVNEKGQEIIPPKFDKAEQFKNGRAVVQNKKGFVGKIFSSTSDDYDSFQIDKTGKIIRKLN